MATTKQVSAIYALGTKCRLYEKVNKKDNLHAFVWQLSLKTSIRALTDEEAARVIRHLKDCHRTLTEDPNRVPTLGTDGLITKQQASKIFALMYELQSLDPTLSTATIKQRLAGIISKTLGTTPDLRGDIFKGLTFNQGEKLIEKIKFFVRTAKKSKTK